MVDARFLLLGVVANIVSVFSLFIVAPLLSSLDQNEVIAVMSAPLAASIVLTTLGILRKGSVSGDAAGIVTIGNYPVWMFGFLYTIFALVGYQEFQSKCQDDLAGLTGSLYDCQQIPFSIFLMGFYIATLSLAFVSTFTGLYFLRKTSMAE